MPADAGANLREPQPEVSVLTLGAGTSAAIRRHARNAYPHECCGALIGRDGVVGEAFVLPNATEQGPGRRFLIHADDYRAAERRAREAGADLLGFYHSHPDHPARPSKYDLEHAWPSFSYVIVSVPGGEPGEMTSWRLQDDRSSFEQEPLQDDSIKSAG